MLDAERRGKEGISGSPQKTSDGPQKRHLPKARPLASFSFLSREHLIYSPDSSPYHFPQCWTRRCYETILRSLDERCDCYHYSHQDDYRGHYSSFLQSQGRSPGVGGVQWILYATSCHMAVSRGSQIRVDDTAVLGK